MIQHRLHREYYICDQRSVGQYVSVSGRHDQIFITVGHLWPLCRGMPPWWGDGSVMYSHNSLSLCDPSPSWPHLTVSFETTKKTPWPQSASKLYWLSDRYLSAKLVPAFADRGCNVVSVMDPYGCILGFLDRSSYFFFQAAPQLYSQGWVDPVPHPLHLRKSGSTRKRTRTSESVVRNSDH
jgi:hypothetical protein